jgi:putative SOS response-associated peptidase YedK
MLAPFQSDAMQAWPVSRRVSKAREDDAGLIERI